MAAKEHRTTDSESFARELLTADVSFFEKDKEERFYKEQHRIVELYKINPSQALQDKKKLHTFVKKELNLNRDDEFVRNSYFVEMMDELYYRTHQYNIKLDLEDAGISNFLIEFHTGKDDNTQHIQVTGNKGNLADKVILEYINKNKLSLHYTEKKKEKKSKVKDLEVLSGLDSIISNLTTQIQKNSKTAKEMINEVLMAQESVKKERMDVLNTYENVQRSRKQRR